MFHKAKVFETYKEKYIKINTKIHLLAIKPKGLGTTLPFTIALTSTH